MNRTSYSLAEYEISLPVVVRRVDDRENSYDGRVRTARPGHLEPVKTNLTFRVLAVSPSEAVRLLQGQIEYLVDNQYEISRVVDNANDRE